MAVVIFIPLPPSLTGHSFTMIVWKTQGNPRVETVSPDPEVQLQWLYVLRSLWRQWSHNLCGRVPKRCHHSIMSNSHANCGITVQRKQSLSPGASMQSAPLEPCRNTLALLRGHEAPFLVTSLP